jgi:hypothetical protein
LDLLESMQRKNKKIFQRWRIPNNFKLTREEKENANNWKNVFGQATDYG